MPHIVIMQLAGGNPSGIDRSIQISYPEFGWKLVDSCSHTGSDLGNAASVTEPEETYLEEKFGDTYREYNDEFDGGFDHYLVTQKGHEVEVLQGSKMLRLVKFCRRMVACL